MPTFRRNELYAIIFLIIIALTNLVDFVADMQEGSDPYHIILEMILVAVSLLGIAWLIREVVSRRQQMEQLKVQLEQTHESLDASRAHIKKLGQEYLKVIQAQFSEWRLSPSEKEVAIFLLKGLSFEEIASVRQTKEKTVRQQASSIYRKSGLSGRHEFAAWFFEDFLQ
ncbi:MAG TPA: LuxR family transcriptional regulator [Thiothrix sp.]|nr:LuxR family transcriptional regulator [Thiothrix sp.]